MKYLIAAFAVSAAVLGGCADKEAAEKPKFTCIHPAVMGGTPFQLPADAYFSPRGTIEFTAPDGSGIALVGTICIKVTPVSQ